MPHITRCTDAAKSACESSAIACGSYLDLIKTMLMDLAATGASAGTYGLLLGIERDLTTILQRVAPAHNLLPNGKETTK